MEGNAYVNGMKVSCDFAGMYHEVLSKLKLGVELTAREKSFYLLLVATNEQAKEYLKNEKERKKD